MLWYGQSAEVKVNSSNLNLNLPKDFNFIKADHDLKTTGQSAVLQVIRIGFAKRQKNEVRSAFGH